MTEIRPIVSGVRLLEGGPEVLRQTIDRIGAARGDLTIELYQAAEPSYAAAMLDHVRAGRGLDVLANRNIAKTPGGIVPPTLLDDLRGAGADVREYSAGSTTR